MMKRILLLLCLLLAVFAFAACENGEDLSDTENTDTSMVELGDTPVTITFWHCASEEAGVLLEGYIQQFNEENPYGITVEGIYQGQYADATTLLKTMLSAENVEELPDVMQMDATGKIPYATSGLAFTIDDCLAEGGDEGAVSSQLTGALSNWTYAGEQLGLPFATSTTITYYNADLLAEAGWDHAPATFAEVEALYQDMQAAGLTAKALQCIPNTPTLANWLGQLGSDVVDQENGTAGVASQLACIENGALVEFLTAWQSMYESGALVNGESSVESFVAGETALLIASSSGLASMLEKVDGNFTLGTSPYLRVNEEAAAGATVSGSCLVMFDHQDGLKKAAAWAFVQYLTSGEIQADFAAHTGYVPSNVDAVEDAAYGALLTEYPQYNVAMEQISMMPETMRSVTVGPATDFYYMINQCVANMLDQGQTPEEAAANMEKELNGLLENYLQNNSQEE